MASAILHLSLSHLLTIMVIHPPFLMDSDASSQRSSPKEYERYLWTCQWFLDILIFIQLLPGHDCREYVDYCTSKRLRYTDRTPWKTFILSDVLLEGVLWDDLLLGICKRSFFITVLAKLHRRPSERKYGMLYPLAVVCPQYVE